MLANFFFKQKTAYEISECDWSSDVCSSDLQVNESSLTGESTNVEKTDKALEGDIPLADRDVYKRQTKDIKCKKFKVSSSAMGDMSSMLSGGLAVNIYGKDQDKLISISEDVYKRQGMICGCREISRLILLRDF